MIWFNEQTSFEIFLRTEWDASIKLFLEFWHKMSCIFIYFQSIEKCAAQEKYHIFMTSICHDIKFSIFISMLLGYENYILLYLIILCWKYI